MKELLGKNWRTSLAGLLGAIAIAIYPLIATGEINWNMVVVAAFIAAVGFLAKSQNVTGVGENAETKGEIESDKLKYDKP